MPITVLFMGWAIIFTSCSCWPGHLLLDWSGCQAENWESALSSRTPPQERKWKIKINQECNMLCRKRRCEMTPRNKNSRNSLLFQICCYPFKFKRSFWYMWLLIQDSREKLVMKPTMIRAVPWPENMTAAAYKETTWLWLTLSLDKVMGLIMMAVCNGPLQTEGNGIYIFFLKCLGTIMSPSVSRTRKYLL